MMGPDATKSPALDEAFIVLLEAAGAAAADTTLTAGAAGELLQAALSNITRTRGAILNMTLMEAVLLFPHHPNQSQSLLQIHIPGRRNITTPAGRQPVETLPRPCMPERNMPLGLATLTRAKNTRSSFCKTP